MPESQSDHTHATPKIPEPKSATGNHTFDLSRKLLAHFTPPSDVRAKKPPFLLNTWAKPHFPVTDYCPKIQSNRRCEGNVNANRL